MHLLVSSSRIPKRFRIDSIDDIRYMISPTELESGKSIPGIDLSMLTFDASIAVILRYKKPFLQVLQTDSHETY